MASTARPGPVSKSVRWQDVALGFRLTAVEWQVVEARSWNERHKHNNLVERHEVWLQSGGREERRDLSVTPLRVRRGQVLTEILVADAGGDRQPHAALLVNRASGELLWLGGAHKAVRSRIRRTRPLLSLLGTAGTPLVLGGALALLGVGIPSGIPNLSQALCAGALIAGAASLIAIGKVVDDLASDLTRSLSAFAGIL